MAEILFSMLSLGRNQKYEPAASFKDAVARVQDYYKSMGEDADECIVCSHSGGRMLKAWEQNRRRRWVRTRDAQMLRGIAKKLAEFVDPPSENVKIV